MDYQDAFPDLAHVLLEDSWVLQAAPTEAGLSLLLDAVLLEGHSRYATPRPGEQHCYRTAWLTVTGVDQVMLSGAPPATDATGTSDLGHIDQFLLDPKKRRWVLSGDWGTAHANEPSVTLDFT